VRKLATSVVVVMLIALTLILTAAAVIVFVPLTDCKECQIIIAYEEALRLDIQEPPVVGGPKPNAGPPLKLGMCGKCVRGKRTLLKHWLHRR